MTQRDPDTGIFIGKEPRPPLPAEIAAEIDALERRGLELAAQAKAKFTDCLIAGSFDPVASIAAQLREISERIAALREQLPAVEQQEQERLAEARRREAVARCRALHAHSARAKTGLRDVTLAFNTLNVAYSKLTDGLDGIGAVLTAESGFELAPEWQQEIERRAIADIAATLRGETPHALAEVIDPTLESARAAAAEMQRGVASSEPAETDPPDTGIAPAADTTEPEQQE